MDSKDGDLVKVRRVGQIDHKERLGSISGYFKAMSDLLTLSVFRVFFLCNFGFCVVGYPPMMCRMFVVSCTETPIFWSYGKEFQQA